VFNGIIAVLPVLVGAIADFTEPVNEDCPGQASPAARSPRHAVVRLAFVGELVILNRARQ
jgi:hypothetical protein